MAREIYLQRVLIYVEICMIYVNILMSRIKDAVDECLLSFREQTNVKIWALLGKTADNK